MGAQSRLGEEEEAGGRGKKCGVRRHTYLRETSKHLRFLLISFLHGLTHNADRMHRYHGMLYRRHYFHKEKGEGDGDGTCRV